MAKTESTKNLVDVDQIERMNRSRLIEGARNYAAADKSDPFTFSRCMSHINNGVASGFTKQGEPDGYTATKDSETRQITRDDGSVDNYKVDVYKDIKRA